MGVRIIRAVSSETTVLQIAGRLTTEDVGVLTEEFQAINGAVTLELSELQSADPDGVTTLLEIVSLGAVLRGASPYIELLLKRT
jgi:ABC-type transporter Mla MlaB component